MAETREPADPGAVQDPQPDGGDRQAEAAGTQRRRRVPAGGLEVWDRPGALGPARHRLVAGTDVEVVGRRGHWVHVRTADGVDGWSDGLSLAGVAVGVHPSSDRTDGDPPGHAIPAGPTAAPVPPGPVVAAPAIRGARGMTDDRPHRFTLARGPLVGALFAGVVILGAGTSWHQVHGSTAFELGARHYLLDWGAPRAGREIGWILVYLALPGALLSLIRGVGWIRRVAGLGVIVVCALYVLQWQDVLNAYQAGLGSGRNVWDIVDRGTLVTFAGGLGMVVAPIR